MNRRSTGLFQTWRPDRPRESAFADRVRPDEACSLEAHGQALVVGVEDELLGGGGAVERMAVGSRSVPRASGSGYSRRLDRATEAPPVPIPAEQPSVICDPYSTEGPSVDVRAADPVVQDESPTCAVERAARARGIAVVPMEDSAADRPIAVPALPPRALDVEVAVRAGEDDRTGPHPHVRAVVRDGRRKAGRCIDERHHRHGGDDEYCEDDETPRARRDRRWPGHGIKRR